MTSVTVRLIYIKAETFDECQGLLGPLTESLRICKLRSEWSRVGS
jgi:hypothetical protein